MKKTQKVGTTTNKKSETIEHQNDFSKRWNIKISGNYMALKNRIIVILDGVSFDSIGCQVLNEKYSIKLVKVMLIKIICHFHFAFLRHVYINL